MLFYILWICNNMVIINYNFYCVVEIINYLCLIINIKILNVCVKWFVDLLMINNLFYVNINKVDIFFWNFCFLFNI